MVKSSSSHFILSQRQCPPPASICKVSPWTHRNITELYQHLRMHCRLRLCNRHANPFEKTIWQFIPCFTMQISETLGRIGSCGGVLDGSCVALYCNWLLPFFEAAQDNKSNKWFQTIPAAVHIMQSSWWVKTTQLGHTSPCFHRGRSICRGNHRGRTAP